MKKIEYFFKNLLLQFLLFVTKFKRNNEEQSSSNFSKILFIRLNRIGDALVTTPLLHLIRKKLNPRIFILADKKNYFAFANNPDIDGILIFKRGFKGIFEAINFIKKERIDTIVDLHDDISTTVSYIISMSRAKNKFGLEKENKNLYTKTIRKLDSRNTHVVTRLLEMAKLFNLRIDNSINWIGYYPKYPSLKKAEDFLKKSFEGENYLVGVNISAGSDARFWSVEKFKSLVEFLLNYKRSEIMTGMNVLILSAPKDLNFAEEINKDFKNRFGKTKCSVFCSEDFDEFAAIISNLNLLFTPDTAAVHLAAAFHVPVFGIYVHDTDDMIWSPYGVDFECVTTKDSNLQNVEFNEVKNKFGDFLDKQLSEKSTNA
ncbi:MAG: glycosyltransferase family 9 protein [Ignavibacteriaceae bacterium]